MYVLDIVFPSGSLSKIAMLRILKMKSYEMAEQFTALMLSALGFFLTRIRLSRYVQWTVKPGANRTEWIILHDKTPPIQSLSNRITCITHNLKHCKQFNCPKHQPHDILYNP
jgi:hypothetical protein